MSVGFLSHETAANLVKSKEARLVHSELMLWMKEGGKRVECGELRASKPEQTGASGCHRSRLGRVFAAFKKWLIRNCNYQRRAEWQGDC